MAFLRRALRLPSRPHLRISREIGCTQQTRTEIASGGEGQRGWQSGHPNRSGEGRRGESVLKGLLNFIPKIESSISIQPTARQDWK